MKPSKKRLLSGLIVLTIAGALLAIGVWKLTSGASKDGQESVITATVIASPYDENSQAAAGDEYVLRGDDDKTHHISVLKGENSLPADAAETCISISALKTNDKVQFLLPPSPVHKNTSSDRYYSTCYPGHASESPQYFIKYAD